MRCAVILLAMVVVVVAATAPAVTARGTLSAVQFEARGVTFYAPFEGTAIAAYARGNPRPIFAQNVAWVAGKVGQAVLTQSRRLPGGRRGRPTGLNYDATGHLYGERGTLAYWFKPLFNANDPAILSGPNGTGPYLVNVSAVEDTYCRQFIRAGIKGRTFPFRVVDTRGRSHGPSYRQGLQTWQAGQWHHVVMTWDASEGMCLYDNGELKASTWGRDPFPPATPLRVGVGCAGPTSRPQWTVCADAVYDELVMLDRAVRGAEVRLLMRGQFGQLDRSPPVKYTARQRGDRRVAALMETDPLRPVFRAAHGIVQACWSQRLVTNVAMRFIESAWLADGRWQPRVAFTQGGLTMPREIAMAVAPGEPFNYLFLAGMPPQGSEFALAEPARPLRATAAGACRAKLDAKASRLTLHVPGGSRIGEVQLFQQQSGLPDQRYDRSWRLAAPAPPAVLGAQGVPLLRHLDRADRQLLVPDGTRTRPALVVPPTRTLYLAGAVLPTDVAIRRLLVRLPVRPAAPADVLRVSVPHAFAPMANYFSADMGVQWADTAAGRLELAMDAPGMIYPRGSRPLVAITTAMGFELAGAAELGIQVDATGRQARAFATNYLRLINEEFTSRMSQNFRFTGRGNRGNNRLTRALAHILRFDPDNKRALELSRWARIQRWPPFTAKPAGPNSFPECVKCARMAAIEARHVIHWWIDQRQDRTGYLVGRGDPWNDDTKLFNEYAFLWLLSGDRTLAAAIEKYLAAHWASGRMAQGWSAALTDIVHSAEEASYLAPTLALFDYGDPVHMERLMRTAANVDHWTAVNHHGHRHFRSNFFTARKTKTEGRLGRDVPLNATAMVASMYLAWYSHHPRATRELLEWVDAWVEDTMRETADKPAGYIPSWVDFKTDAVGPDKGPYAAEIAMMMMAAYQLTGDKKYIRPLTGYLDGKHGSWHRRLRMAAADLRRDLGPGAYDDVLLRYADQRTQALRGGIFFPRGLYNQELPGVLGWLITGKQGYLHTAARNAWRCNYYGRNIYTVVDPHKDRVYAWARYALPWMYCGGNALNARGSGPYPTIRISWVDAGYDFAALVRAATPTHLRLSAYNFTDARAVGMRIWRMVPGTYQVRVQPVGAAGETRAVELIRGTQVRLDLPARSRLDVELTLHARGDWSPARADLALSATEGLVMDRGVVTATVHNIGSVAAPACTAVLRRGDRRIAETRIPAIPAPLDFVPRTAKVRLELPPGTGSDLSNLRVVVDPDDKIAEITERNNWLVLGAPGID